jgi:hypothetical protein
MNLFRRWGNDDTFKRYFAQLQSNYSNDFVAFYCNYIQEWGEIDRYPIPHAWDVARQLDPEYAHPSAVICAGRRAPGLFQDPGRQETREPDAGEDVVDSPRHPAAKQHGGAALVDEERSPTPQTTPPPDSTKD